MYIQSHIYIYIERERGGGKERGERGGRERERERERESWKARGIIETGRNGERGRNRDGGVTQ